MGHSWSHSVSCLTVFQSCVECAYVRTLVVRSDITCPVQSFSVVLYLQH